MWKESKKHNKIVIKPLAFPKKKEGYILHITIALYFSFDTKSAIMFALASDDGSNREPRFLAVCVGMISTKVRWPSLKEEVVARCLLRSHWQGHRDHQQIDQGGNRCYQEDTDDNRRTMEYAFLDSCVKACFK
jgi:hypothetical protein